MIDSRKGDLERRIHQLTEERDSLGVSLEEAQDRILMLEKTKREQEAQVRNVKHYIIVHPIDVHYVKKDNT